MLYIEWENFFPPHTATTAATATATTTNNSNNKQEQQQMMIKQGTQGRGGGGGEGVTIQTQEPMDGEVKPTDGALMVEVRVTLQTQEPIEAVAEVRVAGHPRNATQHAWSTVVDVEKAQKPKAPGELQILALWLCFVRVFKRVE